MKQEEDHKQDTQNKSKCGCCGKNEGTEEHICPYRLELFDDDKTMCNCCRECEIECECDI